MKRRRGLISPLLVLLSLAHHSDAAAKTETPICAEACEKSFKTVIFSDVDTESPLLARQYRVVRLETLNQMCRDTFGVSLPGFDIIDSFSDEQISHLFRFNASASHPEEPFDEVVLPEESFFQLWSDTLAAVRYVGYHHVVYSWAMAVFWAVVIAIGMAYRIVSPMSLKGLGRKASRTSFWGWFKGEIITAAAFGHRNARSFGIWGTVPPRIQSLTIFSFILMNVVFTIHGYWLVPGNMYFPSITKQVIRFVSDRTGYISLANFPLIWLFGMRNNIAMYLTGWDFGTYNNFHRWVARVATLQAVIHSSGFLILIFRDGGWSYFLKWLSMWFFQAGGLATIFMCLIMVFSFYWIRRKQYEIFLLLHIASSVLLLFFVHGHVVPFKTSTIYLIWIPVAIWILDRVLRAGRILLFNYKFWKTKAEATYDPSANMVRLRVPCHKSLYKVQPGTYFYLMMLSGAGFWESHPFTVASMPVPADEAGKSLDNEEDTPLLSVEPSPKKSSDHLTFLIRPYDSFTSRLKDAAARQWPSPASVRMVVEGPYGHSRSLQRFDHVVFVVGGSGIVVPLSYIAWLTKSSARTRRVHIHWAIREPAFAATVLKDDLSMALNMEMVKVDLYLTSGDPDGMMRALVGTMPHRIRLHTRRMEPKVVVRAAEEEAVDSSLAVVACGPANMADDARRATVDVMSRRGTVEYVQESFQW